ncbi:MAG TPA: branched-chain amino acid ABC transporter permease [Novosphingobium sp.]|nr:branched-chain amino acid ABC transporter permease [Novosphingobium sp.]
MIWVNALVQGLLLGGIYALAASGLALVFGVMRIINMAHGDIIVVAAFLAQVLAVGLGVSPFVVAVPVVLIVAAAGYWLQRLLVNRALGHDPLPALIMTFGLSIILQNVLLSLFSADSRRLDAGPLADLSLAVMPGVAVGVLPLAMFGVAVLALVGLQWVFFHTAAGRAFRASADDAEIARVMGLDTNHVYALVTSIAFGLAALSGIFMGVYGSFDPFIGPSRLIFAFEVIVIGGMGSIYGALMGGILLGVSQALGAQINPQFQQLAGHLVFLAVIVLHPQGVLARSKA